MNTIATFLAAAGFKGLKNWIWVAIIAAAIAGIWTLVAIADRRHQNALDVARMPAALLRSQQGSKPLLTR